MTTRPNAQIASLVRLRDAALRNLDRADRLDKGSQWITHPEKMRRLSQRVQELDAQIERLAQQGDVT